MPFCLFIAPICSRAEHKSALVDNPSFLADALISASVFLHLQYVWLRERIARSAENPPNGSYACIARTGVLRRTRRLWSI